MEKLTAAEKRVYECIERSLAERGYAPSVRDICEELGYKSTSTVHLYLGRLEQMGFIEREDGKSRAISLASHGQDRRGLPVLGRVTAGVPILAEENLDGFIDFVPNDTKYDKK